MEYRRRRKPNRSRIAAGRKRTFRGGTKNAGDAGRTLLSLLMVGGIVYFVSASAAGTWIAENVMAPVIRAVSSRGEQSKADAGDVPLESETLSASVNLGTETGNAPVSAEVTLPALSCHMLQMGVYSSEENARVQAEILQKQGAGGYIVEDRTSETPRFRVMAAGYDSAESVKSVKTRLIGEGIDCTVHTLSSSAATFRVTADETKLAGIESGFNALKNAEKALCDGAIRFDRDMLSVEEGISLAGSVRTALEADMAELLSLDAHDATLSSLLNAYHDTNAALETLISGAYEDRVAFSARLKYTHLLSAHRYAQLIDSLS